MSVEVSIVIPTRHRASQLPATVESILRNCGDSWELIVVDQSETPDTHQALHDAGMLDNPRLRYQRVPTTGACRARNYGMSIAKGDILAFTDDDCIVPVDWVDRIRRWFTNTPDLAVFFGAVKAPPCDDGWIAEFHPLEDGVVQRDASNVIRRLGLAANMAIHRRALVRIGAFDELLGAGGVFAPADDTDYGYRALALGLKVYAASEPAVLHLGIRRGGELSAGYLFGMAAMSAKHVRCGDIGMLIAPVKLMCALLARGTLCLLKGRRPSGYRGAARILHGLVGSLRYSVDTGGRLYRP